MEWGGRGQMAVDYPHYYIDSKAGGRADTIAINGGLFFLGVTSGRSVPFWYDADHVLQADLGGI